MLIVLWLRAMRRQRSPRLPRPGGAVVPTPLAPTPLARRGLTRTACACLLAATQGKEWEISQFGKTMACKWSRCAATRDSN